MVSSYTMGGFIHILVVIAIVTVLPRLIGRPASSMKETLDRSQIEPLLLPALKSAPLRGQNIKGTASRSPSWRIETRASLCKCAHLLAANPRPSFGFNRRYRRVHRYDFCDRFRQTRLNARRATNLASLATTSQLPNRRLSLA